MTGWPWPLDGAQEFFEDLWDWMGEAAVNAVSVVSDWIWDAIDWLNEELHEAAGWIYTQVSFAIDGLRGSIETFIDDAFEAAGAVWASITEGVGDFTSWLGDKLSDVGAWLHDTIWGWVDGSLRWLTDTFQWLRDEVTETGSWIVDRLGETVTDLAQGGLSWVQEAIAGVSGALGEGFQAFFKWLLEGLDWMATSIADAAAGVRAAVEGTFTPIVGGIMEALTSAVTPGSPDEEVVGHARAFAEGYLSQIMALAEIEGGSVPKLEELLPRAAGIVALNMGAAVAAEIAGAALDQAHPIKNIGFQNIAMDLVASVQMPAMIGPMLAGPVWPAILIPIRYRFNELHPTLVPSPAELVAMMARATVSAEDYAQAMKFHALDKTWSSRLLAAAYRSPGFPDLQLMVWRGELTAEEAMEALKLQGVRPDYLKGYTAILERIPGPGDLIRMAVREAFTRPELDVEFPDEFADWMLKQGYEEIWARYWWRAHWVLVPLGQLYDLYHRGIITREMLEEELKYHDYTPEWRGRLIKLSWDLPGRIDARWMFRWGLIDVDELRNLLIARGLDPEWADEVALATARNQWMTEINRLRDNAKRDYIKGYVVEDQLRANLEGLGYPPEWIEFHVRDALEDGERDLKDDMVDSLGDGYLKDLVTEDQLEAGLKAVIVRPRVVQMEMERLYIRKYRRPKEPTPEKVKVVPVSTLKRAFRDQIIGEPEFRDELTARGYSPADIDLMVAIERETITAEMAEMPEVTKVATLGTLRTAFREGVITVDELVAELEARGYGPEDVDLIVSVEEAKIAG